jgi:Family of unknown function (DUF6177)
MNKGLPLHVIPAPGARPWKTRSLGHALAELPPGSVPAVATLREAQPSYGLVAFLKATDLLWARPTDDGRNLENALNVDPAGAPPLDSGSVAVTGSVLHPAGHATQIGAYTARMLEPFQVSPSRAGDAEPLGWTWDVDGITGWSQSHMPWSALLFSGTHVTGLLTAVRTESGVVESFDALVTSGSPVTDSMRSRAIAQAAALNSAGFNMELHFGADAFGVYSGADQFRVPLAAVLGPDLLKGVDVAPLSAEGVALERLGFRPFQHLAVRFPLVTAWDGGRGHALRQQLLQAK